jgi:N4-gp56 family major capsid protein
MARTTILPTDPSAVKAWAAEVALDSKKKTFFNKMTGKEGSSMPVVIKTDLESGPGDEVTTTLIAKIKGKPVEGAEKLAGRAQRLSNASHKMKIDKHRQAVNVGDIMDQKRVNWSITQQAKDRLSDYLAEIMDEQCTMTVSGSRGTGTEIQHYPVGYAGFPNAFVAADSNHYMVFDGSRANGAALTTGDKLGTNVIDKLKLRTSKQIGGQPSSPVAMQPIDVSDSGGGPAKCFVFLTGPEGMYDLRREVGDAGWLTLEKAKVTSVGAKSPIFQGGKALYNGVVIDETQTVVKWASGDTSDVDATAFGAAATRSMFLGANAVAVAYGTKGQRDNMRYELSEADEDYGEVGIVIVRLVAGWSKCRYNSMDFGAIVCDHAFTAAT